MQVRYPHTNHQTLSRAMIETERSRRLESQLSAAEERLRLSQDLHDTMGQHLAALTIKTVSYTHLTLPTSDLV